MKCASGARDSTGSFFFQVLFLHAYPTSFDRTGVLTGGLHSLFSTLPNCLLGATEVTSCVGTSIICPTVGAGAMMFPHSAFFCLQLRQLDEYWAGELLSFLHENSSPFKECTTGKYACLVGILKPWPHHNTTKTAAAQLTNC